MMMVVQGDIAAEPIRRENCQLMNERNEAMCRRAAGVGQGDGHQPGFWPEPRGD